jgi:hypothetical protein
MSVWHLIHASVVAVGISGAPVNRLCFAPWQESRAEYGSAEYARDVLKSAVAVVRARLVRPDPGPFVPDTSELPAQPATAMRIRTLRFVVLERLKGETADTLEIAGRIVGDHPVNDGPFPYAWPRHRGGDCFSWDYRIGGEYLFLLAKSGREKRLTPYWASMTLSSEALKAK